MDKPIDELIDQVYARSDLATAMFSALRDPLVKRWPKALRKKLRIPIIIIILQVYRAHAVCDYGTLPAKQGLR
jgi:hypothetical protein